MNRRILATLLTAAAMLAGGMAKADVFNMSTGKTSLEFVTVGNPGNSPDTRFETPGYGAVDYVYQIGQFEITAGQYTVFLNSVAGVDTHGLYNTSMWTSTYGCKIERFAGSGTVGDPYQYRVVTDWANRPVNFVSWGDAARFTNWLHNGQPGLLSPVPQDADSTEDGAYFLNGTTSHSALMAVPRNPGARYWMPTDDEWYKAAYYDPTQSGPGGYWLYPTRSDSVPSNQLIDPDPGNNATFYANGYTIGGPYWRTEVGAHGNSASYYGTFDQGGNVWEWNEATWGSSLRGIRGGAWQQYTFIDGYVPLLASYHYSGTLGPTHEGYTVGFRVATIPEPGGITLLLCCAAMSLMWWRRRR
jgi:formylglycine-generating enzyme